MTPKKKKELYSLLLLIAMILLYLLFFRKERSTSPSTAHRTDHREAAFRHHRIYYTKHAKCRMDCREIDESEVKEILKDGTINYNKSELKSAPCPKYAIEGITHDKQHVRIIVGDCSSQASIITVIDLDHEFECDCK